MFYVTRGSACVISWTVLRYFFVVLLDNSSIFQTCSVFVLQGILSQAGITDYCASVIQYWKAVICHNHKLRDNKIRQKTEQLEIKRNTSPSDIWKKNYRTETSWGDVGSSRIGILRLTTETLTIIIIISLSFTGCGCKSIVHVFHEAIGRKKRGPGDSAIYLLLGEK